MNFRRHIDLNVNKAGRFRKRIEELALRLMWTTVPSRERCH